MSKPKARHPQKANKTSWVKGDPRVHRGGRPPISEDVKRARKMNQAQFTESVEKIISMRRGELERLVESKDSNVLEQLIATIWLKGIKDSSRLELNYFVERFMGKVPENHNFSGNFHGGIMEFLTQMRNQRKQLKGAANGKQEDNDSEDETEETGQEEID